MTKAFPESKRRAWVQTIKAGAEVEVVYSLDAQDIVPMKVLSNDGAHIRLLPVGARDDSENWTIACAVAGATIPYGCRIYPPGTAVPLK